MSRGLLEVASKNYTYFCIGKGSRTVISVFISPKLARNFALNENTCSVPVSTCRLWMNAGERHYEENHKYQHLGGEGGIRGLSLNPEPYGFSYYPPLYHHPRVSPLTKAISGDLGLTKGTHEITARGSRIDVWHLEAPRYAFI